MTPATAGQPLTIRAADWNRVVRATEAVESQLLNERDLKPLGNGEIWVRNQWAFAIPAGDRVGIDGPIFYQLPSDTVGLDRIRDRQVIYAVDKPKWPINQRIFATLLEPLAPQAIGRALVCGVAPAYVDKHATSGASAFDLRFVTPHLSRTTSDDERRTTPWISHDTIEVSVGRGGVAAPSAESLTYTGHAAQVLAPLIHEHAAYDDLEADGCTGDATVSCVNDRWVITENDCDGTCDPYRTVEYDTATFPFPCDGLSDRVIPCRNILDADRRLVDVVLNNETHISTVPIISVSDPANYRINDDWCGWRQCIYHCSEVTSGVYEHVLTHSECRSGADVDGVTYANVSCGCRAIEDLPDYRICDELSVGAEFRLQCEAQTFTTAPPPTTVPPTTAPPTTAPPTTAPPTTAPPPCTGECDYIGDRYEVAVECGTRQIMCYLGLPSVCPSQLDPGYGWGTVDGNGCNVGGTSTEAWCSLDTTSGALCDYYDAWVTAYGQCDATTVGDVHEVPCVQDAPKYNYYWLNTSDTCTPTSGGTCYCDDSALPTASVGYYGSTQTVGCGTTPTTSPPTTAPPTTAPPTTAPPTTEPPTTAPPTTAPPTTAPPTTAPPTTAPPDPYGACCVASSCVYTTLSECTEVYLGFHYGEGSSCSPSPCGNGACCDGTSCSELSEAACEALYGPGNYQGDGTDCDPNPCV